MRSQFVVGTRFQPSHRKRTSFPAPFLFGRIIQATEKSYGPVANAMSKTTDAPLNRALERVIEVSISFT